MTGVSPLLQFPCAFPIKAFGYGNTDLDALVTEIVRRHVPALKTEAIATRSSTHGKFTAVTVTIRAESQAQIDAIYRDLCGCSAVIMAL